MDMVAEQRPKKKESTALFGEIPQSSDKVFPVPVITKNRFPFDSSNHHMMQRS